MKRFFYIFIALVLVALAIWGFSKYAGRSVTSDTANNKIQRNLNEEVVDRSANGNKTTVDGQEQQNSVEHTVTYYSSGFSPSIVRIKKGDKVTFINRSSTQMWVASDPHPLHTGLSGFDAGKGIAKNESYSFTFMRTGNFGYHNHLSPSHSGTVVVAD